MTVAVNVTTGSDEAEAAWLSARLEEHVRHYGANVHRTTPTLFSCWNLPVPNVPGAPVDPGGVPATPDFGQPPIPGIDPGANGVDTPADAGGGGSE